MNQATKVRPIGANNGAPLPHDDPKEPEKVRIVLKVCNCFPGGWVGLYLPKANWIADILGISVEELRFQATQAMKTSQPQVVWCGQQADVAETKLAQLGQATPFILLACHSFELA